MLFPSPLTGLPLSLIISSFFAVALPVHSTLLTPQNFKATTEKGLWFIEHFSPYCPHCIHFKPTWDLLAEQESSLGVSLAQVDCSVHGDLCNENGVKGYPQMTLFKDGQIVEVFKGNRDLEKLTGFLKRHADPKAENKAPATASSPPPPPLIVNPSGIALELREDTFQKVIDTGPTFVKFYAPWCGHCRKLAPTWKQLAQQMKDKVVIAEVNCDDERELCDAQGVKGFPSLIFYGTSGVFSEYTGSRRLDQLSAFAEKASSMGTMALKADELGSRIAEEDVVYLYLHAPEDTEGLRTIKEASSVLLGSPTVYTSSSAELFNRYHIPAGAPFALIAFKDHDDVSPTSMFSADKNGRPKKAILEQWLLQNRIPTVVELSQDNFQAIMNPPSAPGASVVPPLVFLVPSTDSSVLKISERLKNVAREWKIKTGGTGLMGEHSRALRQVIFAWMDQERWGDWIKSMYGIPKRSPDSTSLDDMRVALVDHAGLVYWDMDSSGRTIKLTSSASIFSAIEGAMTGKIKPKNSENAIERTARYFNNKLLALERFVSGHPFYSLFIFAGIITGVIFVLKSLLTDNGEREYRKVNRLD